jgi:hypothetical protein
MVCLVWMWWVLHPFSGYENLQEPLRSHPLGLGRAGGCYDLLGSGGNLENSDDLDGGALDWGKSTVFNEGKWTRTFQDS